MAHASYLLAPVDHVQWASAAAGSVPGAQLEPRGCELRLPPQVSGRRTAEGELYACPAAQSLLGRLTISAIIIIIISRPAPPEPQRQRLARRKLETGTGPVLHSLHVISSRLPFGGDFH